MGDINTSPRRRDPELAGAYATQGNFRITAQSGLVTVVEARTATAGHLFAMRWTDATRNCYIRYVGARFTATTAYTTAQETGCDLVIARGYTASHSGGTAVDVGGTVSGTGKLATRLGASLVGDCRISNTAALTAGTHTLDAQAISIASHWTSAIGTQLVNPNGQPVTLFDARSDESPIVLDADEGIVIRNTILMGAVGVGRWCFTVEYEQGIPGA